MHTRHTHAAVQQYTFKFIIKITRYSQTAYAVPPTAAHVVEVLYTHARTHARSQAHTHTHPLIYWYTSTHIHLYIGIHKHTHSLTHTHTHTYTHTHRLHRLDIWYLGQQHT